MNHQNSSESECSSRFSLDSSSERSSNVSQSVDNNEHEHVYENIIRVRKNCKRWNKMNRLNELIVKLKTKSLPKAMWNNNSKKKLKTKHGDVRGSEDFDEIDFDEGSYTSCVEENIYEDLDFYSCTSTMTTIYEDSVNAWLQLTSTSFDEYDENIECDLMSHKSIPFRRDRLWWNCQQSKNSNYTQYQAEESSLFELQKLEIIQRLLVSIWYQQTESGILKSLFIILKEIFTEYLKRETPMAYNNSLIKCEKNENTTKKLQTTNEMTFIIDKTKLEHFILSITLNKRLITYDKNLKFIFTIKSTPWLESYSNENFRRIKRRKSLTPIEWRSDDNLVNDECKKEKSEENLNNCVSSGRGGGDESQHIYQQLWTCRDSSVGIDSDESWEIDSEFRFEKFHSPVIMPFSEVQVYCKDDFIAPNLLTYSLKPVEDWKCLMRSMNYIEDEEDMFMSEYQMISLNLIDEENFHSKSTLTLDDSLNSLTMLTMNDTSAKTDDIKILNESLSGTYKVRNENELHSSQSDISTTGSLDSKNKRERERFRDKVKNKLKFKTSKAQEMQVPEKVYLDVELENVYQDENVPQIVRICCEVLEENGNITTPGLYRVSGNKTIIDGFRKKINSKKKLESVISTIRDQDVHTIAGILKMFIRELQPPLVNAYVFDQCTNDDISFQDIKRSLSGMPEVNFSTLKFLIAHLTKVEKEKNFNLMTSSNLAICWGLCLFSKSVRSKFYVENDVSKCNVMCKKLIEHFYDIF